MDNEVDQAINDLVSNDTVKSVSRDVDDPLDAALVDMVPTLPDF